MAGKRQRNWRQFVIGFVCGSALCLLLAYWAMDLAVDYVMRQMVPERVVVTPSGVVADATEDVVDSKDVSDGQTKADSGTSETDGTASGKSGASSASQQAAENGYRADISEQRAKTVEEQITVKEKMLVTSIVMDNFSTKELELFSKLASGGLNKEEKKEMRELFLQKMSEEEYNQLIAVAAKYGLSQGRQYEDVKK
jgi:hypothetical protein